ncbi:hypothetical protein JCM19297_2499 [Nonlabens ulvanivorans]|nr:hypothetical protein JCM19297_2499 [Nonlabens ulvanivorans]
MAGGGNLPTGWSSVNNVTSQDIDRGSYYLLDAGSPSDIIESDVLDLSAFASAELDVDITSFGSGGHNSLKLEISTDNGTTFSQTEITQVTTGSYVSVPTIVLMNISSQMILRFTNNGGSGRGIRLQKLILNGIGVSGANQPPMITNLTQSPDQNIISTNDVTIGATIVDDSSVTSAVLKYDVVSTGTVFDGSYDYSIPMSNVNDEYTAIIPSQADLSTIFYVIEATDDDMTMALSSSTAQFSYDVADPVVTNFIAIQNFDNSAPLWSYTNSLAFFDNGFSDGSGNGFYGPLNINDASPISNVNFAGNIFAENDLNDTPGGTSGFASMTFEDVDVTGFVDVQISFDYDIRGYNANNDDAKYEVFIDGLSAGEVFLLDGNGSADDANGSVIVNVPDGSNNVSLVVSVRNNGNTGYSGFDNFIVNGTSPSTEYVFDGSSWSPTSPEGNSTTSDIIRVTSGTIAFTGDVDAKDLLVENGATLDLGANVINLRGDINAILNATLISDQSIINLEGVLEQEINVSSISIEDLIVNNANGAVLNGVVDLEGVLTLTNGSLTTNDNLTFKSIAGTSAVLAPVVSGSITGDVTVEQFYPAQRAFRFVSSPVDMTGTLFDNWQQGGLNPGDAGYLAGIGTQITGGTSGGFDISGSNNPSAFAFSNDGTQVWQAPVATNDMNASLSAGTPYRLFIRGDRSIDLTISDMPNDTKLTTTGKLKLNDAVQSFDASLSTGDFVFAGNPYQAKVDVGAMIFDMATRTQEDINPNFMYVWNPQAGSRGAYRAYDFSTDSSTPTDVEVAGELQPGQSMFLQILNDADSDVPSVTFKESYKVSGSNLTSTFSVPQGFLSLDIYQSNTIALDGFKINFDSNGTDLIDSFDLLKVENLDENISITNGVTQLAIENRSVPTDGTIIPLEIKRFANGNYNFTTRLSGVNNLNTYLFDAYTNQYHLIGTDVLANFSFSFDNSISATVALDRFSIYFSNVTLSELDVVRTDTISMYPNPINEGSLQIKGLNEEIETIVEIHNLSGQLLIRRDFEAHNGQVILTNLDNLNMGVYLLTVQQGRNSSVEKIVIK